MQQVPSILQQLNGGQISPQLQQMLPAINRAKQLISVVRSTGNLPAVLQQAIQTNPQAQQAMQMLQSGGDITGMISALAQQRGIDPNELIKMLE